MLEAFIAKGYVASGIITNNRDESLDFQAFPPILRTLLVTDGTVTKVLEAYYWEPVNVVQLGQHLETLTEDMEGMGCKAGETVIRRNVSLDGAQSGDVYAYATSVIRTAALPDDVRDGLLEGRIGIGQLLRKKGLETYREVIDIYREIAKEVLPGCDVAYCGELICRTYYIYFHDVPAIQVTEKFPYRLFIKKN